MTKRSLDKVLDQALQERAGELSMFEDIPIPSVQDAMGAFHHEALRRKKPRYQTVLRLAASLVFLVGVSAGIYLLMQRAEWALPVASNLEEGEAMPMAAAGASEAPEEHARSKAIEALSQNSALMSQPMESASGKATTTQESAGIRTEEFDEVTHYFPLQDALAIFAKLPVLDLEEEIELTYWESAPAPLKTALLYMLETPEGTLSVSCSIVEKDTIASIDESIFEDGVVLEMDGLELTAYIAYNEEKSVTEAYWTNNDDTLYRLESAMDMDLMVDYMGRLTWYTERS